MKKKKKVHTSSVSFFRNSRDVRVRETRKGGELSMREIFEKLLFE